MGDAVVGHILVVAGNGYWQSCPPQGPAPILQQAGYIVMVYILMAYIAMGCPPPKPAPILQQAGQEGQGARGTGREWHLPRRVAA